MKITVITFFSALWLILSATPVLAETLTGSIVEYTKGRKHPLSCYCANGAVFAPSEGSTAKQIKLCFDMDEDLSQETLSCRSLLIFGEYDTVDFDKAAQPQSACPGGSLTLFRVGYFRCRP